MEANPNKKEDLIKRLSNTFKDRVLIITIESYLNIKILRKVYNVKKY